MLKTGTSALRLNGLMNLKFLRQSSPFGSNLSDSVLCRLMSKTHQFTKNNDHTHWSTNMSRNSILKDYTTLSFLLIKTGVPDRIGISPKTDVADWVNVRHILELFMCLAL